MHTRTHAYTGTHTEKTAKKCGHIVSVAGVAATAAAAVAEDRDEAALDDNNDDEDDADDDGDDDEVAGNVTVAGRKPRC